MTLRGVVSAKGNSAIAYGSESPETVLRNEVVYSWMAGLSEAQQWS